MLSVGREGIICAVCGLKTTGLDLHSFTCWFQYWFSQTLDWSYYFCVRCFSISIHSIEAFLFAAFVFLCNMNFYLAAQIMEWSTYPIILCLEFRLSDCVKRERGVKWYLVPVCDIVCGLFATLCTGPQGHTHIIYKQLSAVLPKMKCTLTTRYRVYV